MLHTAPGVVQASQCAQVPDPSLTCHCAASPHAQHVHEEPWLANCRLAARNWLPVNKAWILLHLGTCAVGMPS